MRPAALAALLVMAPAAARAEVELSFYGGWQSAPHSGVAIAGDAAIPDRDFTAGWEGRSFSAPVHAGGRLTWWGPLGLGEAWGVGIDVNHAKVYADDETLAGSGLDHLEFSDGLNIVTVNGYRRFAEAPGPLTPYLGAGLGVAVPHVEVRGGGSETWEYQLAGPAVAWIAGASYDLTERWSVFGEYKGTYSRNDADLDGGGTLSTDIVTNALNMGVSFSF